MEETQTLVCENLSKQYGKLVALDAVNLALPTGRIVGLLGPNGSGKTTLIKLANGLLRPTTGSVRVCGNDIGKESKALVSYLPDRICLDQKMRVAELAAFYRDFYDDFDTEAARTMLAALDIDTTKRLKTLSKGNREKVQLVLVMARRARLYLLDEPIGGVDPAARDYIIATIMTNYRASGGTVLISTHLIQDVESILDDVIFLQRGKIILHGGAEALRAEHGKSIDELFREMFKC